VGVRDERVGARGDRIMDKMGAAQAGFEEGKKRVFRPK
jgi:hypothetical protein